MKSLLLALSLFSVSSVALAQSTAKSASKPTLATDTLLTLSEEDLMRAVRSVAEARLAAEGYQTSAGLSARELRLAKLQMLLNALGLGDQLAAPATSHAPVSQDQSRSYQAPHPAQRVQPQQGSGRIDRLEQLMLLLLQRREAERVALALPARSAKGEKVAPTPAPGAELQPATATTASSDSLLRAIQEELVALRAAQAQQPQQPQQVEQPQPQLQPAQVIVEQPAPAPVSMPQPVVETRIVPVVSHFKRQVFFALGKSELLPEARLALNEVYRILSTDAEMKLYLTGYSSPDGNAAQNERLSRLRSQAVLDYLTACGISADRLISVAGGIDRNTDLMSSARRVDIELKK